ncbi:MAG: hypothetical protein ACU0CO_10200 [Shimia sp.]
MAVPFGEPNRDGEFAECFRDTETNLFSDLVDEMLAYFDEFRAETTEKVSSKQLANQRETIIWLLDALEHRRTFDKLVNLLSIAETGSSPLEAEYKADLEELQAELLAINSESPAK